MTKVGGGDQHSTETIHV